jgi:hypothetical protein
MIINIAMVVVVVAVVVAVTTIYSAHDVRPPVAIFSRLHAAVIRPHNTTNIAAAAAHHVTVHINTTNTHTTHASQHITPHTSHVTHVTQHNIVPDVDGIVPHMVAPDAAVRPRKRCMKSMTGG